MEYFHFRCKIQLDLPLLSLSRNLSILANASALATRMANPTRGLSVAFTPDLSRLPHRLNSIYIHMYLKIDFWRKNILKQLIWGQNLIFTRDFKV